MGIIFRCIPFKIDDFDDPFGMQVQGQATPFGIRAKQQQMQCFLKLMDFPLQLTILTVFPSVDFKENTTKNNTHSEIVQGVN